MEHSITLSYICEVLSPRKLPDRMNPHSKPLELIAKSHRPHFRSNFGNSGSQTSTPILRPFHLRFQLCFLPTIGTGFSDIFWCSKKLSKRKSYGQKRVFFAQIKHKLHKNGAFLPFPSIWHTFFGCTLACLSVLSMYNKNWGWISIGCAYPRKRSKHTPPQMWGPYPHIWWVSLNPKP